MSDRWDLVVVWALGIALQYLVLLGLPHSRKQWKRTVCIGCIAVAGSFLFILNTLSQIGFESASLAKFLIGFFMILAMIVNALFAEHLLPWIHERELHVWNMLYVGFILSISDFLGSLTYVALVPGAAVAILVSMNISEKSIWAFVQYSWFLCIVGVLGTLNVVSLLHNIRHASVFDVFMSGASFPLLLIAGTWCVIHLHIPMTVLSRKPWKMTDQPLKPKMNAAQLHIGETLALMLIIGSAAVIVARTNVMPYALFVHCVLIGLSVTYRLLSVQRTMNR